MRPVNLIPGDHRSRTAGPSDNPMPAYAVVGTLAAFALMMLVVVVYSNKITTANDEAAAATAAKAQIAVPVKAVQPFNDFADTVNRRTLLIGALAESRFPWHLGMFNLSRSIPEDVTLDTIKGTVAAGAAPAGAPAATSTPSEPVGATLELAGCGPTHAAIARMVVRMQAMPGVQKVSLANSTRAALADPAAAGGAATTGVPATATRSDNCGKRPAKFAMKVEFATLDVDLTGLPKPEAIAAPAAGATGATAAAPSAAADSTAGL